MDGWMDANYRYFQLSIPFLVVGVNENVMYGSKRNLTPSTWFISWYLHKNATFIIALLLLLLNQNAIYF